VGEQHHLRQFLILVFCLLVPCFVLWTLISGVIAMPAIGLVKLLLTDWFPTVVHTLYPDGAKAVLLTQFGELNGKMVPLASAEYRLGFQVNANILTYSLPFYTALHFATPKKAYLGSYGAGLLTLYLFILFGLVCLCLKELMVNVGAPFFNQPGVYVPGAGVIGILYQLNVLIVPTLAPAMLWLWQSKESPLLLAALGNRSVAVK
jgi:hypothetical protein